MSIRLDELRRQRALVQEHLAWLDREIAAAEPAKAAAPAAPAAIAKPAAATLDARVSLTPATSLPAAAKNAVAVTVADVDSAADRILQEYRVAPDTMRQDVRKGCLLYFAAAFALFALGVVALYFALRSH